MPQVPESPPEQEQPHNVALQETSRGIPAPIPRPSSRGMPSDRPRRFRSCHPLGIPSRRGLHPFRLARL
jgi:hypothetical protein